MSERRKVDWGAVHARLTATGEALQRGGAPGPDERRTILRQRAIELADPPPSTPANLHFMSVVGFRLGSRNFAVDAAVVGSVLPYREMVPVPCTPNYILGLVNARGQILSVTDLKIFLGIPPTEAGRESKIMVWSRGGLEFGVLVDGLYDVKEIIVENIKPPDKAVDFVWGTTPEGQTVLDAPRLLSDRRLVIGE